MTGIIIGDLMSNNKGKLDKNSTPTIVTITTVAIMDWLIGEEKNKTAKEVIQEWKTKYNVENEQTPITVYIPIANYAQDFMEFISITTDEEISNNKTKEAVGDLIDGVKNGVPKSKILKLFKEGYRDTELDDPLRVFSESREFWGAVTEAIKLKGNKAVNAGIVGGLSELNYGLSDSIRKKAFSLIPEEMLKVVKKYEMETKKRNSKEAIALLRFKQR